MGTPGVSHDPVVGTIANDTDSVVSRDCARLVVNDTSMVVRSGSASMDAYGQRALLESSLHLRNVVLGNTVEGGDLILSTRGEALSAVGSFVRVFSGCFNTVFPDPFLACALASTVATASIVYAVKEHLL